MLLFSQIKLFFSSFKFFIGFLWQISEFNFLGLELERTIKINKYDLVDIEGVKP